MIITILLILVFVWRAHRYGSIVGNPPLSDFSVSALKWFPTREGSRLWGWLTNLEVPVSLRKPIYGLYSRIFGVNLDEAEYPMEAYPSLARFFTRNLKKGTRWIDPQADMISPVDGRILHFGVMKEDGSIEQVKGIDYTLEQMIGPDAVNQLVEMRQKAFSDPQLEAERKEELERALFSAKGGRPDEKTSWSEIFMNWLPFLDFSRQKLNTAPVAYNTYYCVIYLAPGDYHAFHAPVDFKCLKMRHFPGDLFSVSPVAARWIKGLFAINERIVLSGYWRHGFMSYIPVGAYNVGSITLEFDDEINTNQRGDNFTYRERTYRDLDINMGEKIGWFNLGSTIVMVFDAPQFVFRVTRGQKVKLGQVLGNILTPDLKEEIELENEFRVRAAMKRDDKTIQQLKDITAYDKNVERVKAGLERERNKIEQVRAEREAQKAASK